MASLLVNRIKQDLMLTEAYTLFREEDSVARLHKLLRQRWGRVIAKSSQAKTKSATAMGAGAGTEVLIQLGQLRTVEQSVADLESRSPRD